MAVLDIDAGNSRIKWRLSDGALMVARGSVESPAEMRASLPADQISRVRLASVRVAERTHELVQVLSGCCKVPVEVARVSAWQAGVTNAYENAAGMGIDRWLAVLAAYHRSAGRGCCIVSCGTALTVDAVGADGQHEGGFIIPGLTLQRSSLLARTAIRLPEQIDWSVVVASAGVDPVHSPLGRSTEEAVNRGILCMLVAALVNLPCVIRAAEQETLILTGGDAMSVSTALRLAGLRHRVDPDIILDGLALALP